MNEYAKIVRFINSTGNFERKGLSPLSSNKLSRINLLFKKINNPEKKLKVIQVAGTNGKGSTATMLAYSLAGCGYKIGLYTSPHLVNERERIATLFLNKNNLITRKNISKNKLIKYGNYIKNIYKHNKNNIPTTFEIWTAVAALYFLEQQVDYAIIEVGLGGRLDATSLFKVKILIFTSIALDHQYLLGNNIKKIAQEKLALIKEKQIIISAPQEKIVNELLLKYCKQKKCELLFSTEKIKISKSIFNKKLWHYELNLKINSQTYKNIVLPLVGKHQLENLKNIVCCLNKLKEFFIVDLNQAFKGLSQTKWLARLQLYHKKPLIIIDGAHNIEGINYLISFLNEYLNNKIFIFCFGILKNKDALLILKKISTIAKTIFLVKIDSPRSEKLNYLKNLIEKNNLRGEYQSFNNVHSAISYFKNNYSSNEALIVTGSLYLAGGVLVK